MPDSQRNFADFLEILGEFDEAMLVTERGHQLRSRPMAIADCTEDGRVRFITRDDSGKLQEIDENSNVNVAMQGTERFLSISGVVRLSKDRQLIDTVWERKHNPWFEHGRDDPHVIVLEVIPECVEYWDRSDASLTTRIIDAMFDTDRPDDRLADAGDAHGRVDFDEVRR